MAWHKNTLLKYKKEITQSAVVSFALSLIFAVYLWHLGNPFVWQSISPIEQPSIFERPFYSALVYLGPGAILFSSGFYKILCAPFRGMRGGYKEYKKTKNDIWNILMLLMYLYVIPFMVSVLNTIISFFYNVLNLVLYLSPTFGVFLISTILISYIYINTNKSPVIVNSTKN